jgi:hypothetical protein
MGVVKRKVKSRDGEPSGWRGTYMQGKRGLVHACPLPCKSDEQGYCHYVRRRPINRTHTARSFRHFGCVLQYKLASSLAALCRQCFKSDAVLRQLRSRYGVLGRWLDVPDGME